MCGRELARQRLMDILPKQIGVWHSTPTVANEVAKEELERIRKRMILARKELESLGISFCVNIVVIMFQINSSVCTSKILILTSASYTKKVLFSARFIL